MSRQFAVTDELAIPVDQITGILIREKETYSGEPLFGFFERTVPARMIIDTENGRYSIKDAKLAKRFIRSLGPNTNIYDARADDLIREIDRCLT